LSRNTNIKGPIITSDGRFQCEADNRVFNTREDYDKHCNNVHIKNQK